MEETITRRGAGVTGSLLTPCEHGVQVIKELVVEGDLVVLALHILLVTHHATVKHFLRHLCKEKQIDNRFL